MGNYKNDFKPFEIGTVFNKLVINAHSLKPLYKEIVLKYPSRLEAMALDPSRIATNANLVYKAGQINFKVSLFKTITISIRTDSQIVISPTSSRPTLIRHSIELMRDILKFDCGFDIDVEDRINLRHCGLGSSSSLIAAIAASINELFGNPVDKQVLVRYLAQNHGEEMDGNDQMLTPVQCIGGSGCAGMFEGGVQFVAGESTLICNMNLGEEYKVVIGIPKDYKHPDAKYLMEEEEKNLEKFKACGEKYSPIVAYRVVHECLPAVKDNKLDIIGDLIFDYRFNMGSIENCSFVYPPLVELTNSIAFLKKERIVDVLSISSVGPGIFAVTKNYEICENHFRNAGLNTYISSIHNDGYKILKLI